MPETATVTLLFCDVVGSTELLTSLGDDANDEVRRAFLSALELEAHEHRGTVVKSIGDALMVSFRASAADAVACAIAMQRAVPNIERDGARLGLELRVGISSGEAAFEDGDWFGAPVVEAARLESAARPGQILVSEVVRSIVGTRGSTKFRAAGTRELKGFARPVPVVEVVWRDDSTPRPVKRKAKRPRRRRTLVAGVALLAVAGVAVAAGLVFALRDSGQGQHRVVSAGEPLVAKGYVPKLEPRACPADMKASNPDLRCSDLVVPEDRSKPTGRQLRLLVIVAPSRVQPAGIPTLSISYFSAESDLRNYGDSITIATRGQDAQPPLTCPEVVSVNRERLALPLNGPEANKLYLDAAEQCGKRLVSEGIDLNAYGQQEIADDVRDLAIATSWRQINIQAVTDWTRIAVLLAVRYPALVRSVVIAEPLAVGDSQYNGRILYYAAALQAYYAACRADAACEKAFPDLEQNLPALYHDQKPAVLSVPDPYGGPDIPVMSDGDRIVEAVADALGSQGALPFLASGLASREESARLTGASFLVGYAGLESNVPWGAWFSGYCEDQESAVNMTAVGAAEGAYPLFRELAHDPWLQLCDRWPTRPRLEALQELKAVSTAPALILTGALNPNAPPDYANAVARSFTDATVAVFPRIADDVLSTPCVSALRLAFLRDPTADLDDDRDGCIAQVRPIAFEGTDRSGATPTGLPTSAP